MIRTSNFGGLEMRGRGKGGLPAANFCPGETTNFYPPPKHSSLAELDTHIRLTVIN